MVQLSIPSPVTAVIGMALTLCVTAVQAQISLDADFDHGSLKSFSVLGNTVNLIGRDNYAGSGNFIGSGKWRWLNFKASGVQGINPHFSISSDFAGDATPGPHELTDHEMVYSYDGENWQFFEINSLDLGATTFTFYNSSPFTQNEVFVTYALPYSYERSVAHAQSVMSSSWAMPTNSGDANGVIGQSPAGTDDLGRSIPARDLYAYRITNPATDSPATTKRRAMFVTGQHASETLGIHTYQGLIDWLISDDPRAGALRDQVEVFGYPILNASGRYAGLTRAMLQHPNTDSNGFWDPSEWGNRIEQRKLGEAMFADIAPGPGKILDLMVDFHSSVPDYDIVGPNGQGTSGRDDWGYIKTGQGDDLNPWWLALRDLQPNVLQVTSGGGSDTTIGFAETFLNADMDVTFENQFAISRPISYYHELGRNVGLAMYQAWVQVDNPMSADFDEDGDVDAGDLAAWQLGYGLVDSAEHYQGDADGDGDSDGIDLLMWQQQYTGLLDPLISAETAPEPATWIVLLCGMMAMLFRRDVVVA